MTLQLVSTLMVALVSCLSIVFAIKSLRRLEQSLTECVEMQRSYSQSLSSMAHTLKQCDMLLRAMRTEHLLQ